MPAESTHWKIRNTAGLLKLHGLQLVLVLVFLVIFYWQEALILAEIAPPPRPFAENRFHEFLAGLQWPWLPGGGWRLFVPLGLVAFAFLLLSRFRWQFLAIAGFLGSLLLIADRVYHAFFSSVISWYSLKAAPQVWGVKASVFSTLTWTDLGFLLCFPIFFLFGRFVHRRIAFEAALRIQNLVADKAFALLAGALALHAAYVAFYLPANDLRLDSSGRIVENAPGGETFAPLHASSHKHFAVTFGMFNFHLADWRRALTTSLSRGKVSDQDLAMVEALLAEKKTLNDLESPLFGLAKGRNVVLISMEAFQQYVVGLASGDFEVTPTLNRFREDALYWPNIIDNVGTGGTSDAEFSVMTGLMADTRKMAALEHVTHNRLVALPATLKRHGYRTLSMHGNDPSFWNRDVNHPLLGIEQMLFRGAFPAETLGMGVPDDLFFEQAGEWLQELSEPYFAYLISLSSHHPFHEVPEAYRNRNFEGIPQHSLAANYLRIVHYADRALGTFLAWMQATAAWERTLFVIYGDHIAPMGTADRKTLQNVLGFDPAGVRAMRVPLFILVPGKEAEIRAHRAAYAEVTGGLQDIFPTVCHLLGLDVPFGVTGTHLFVPNQRRHATYLPRKADCYVYHGAVYASQRGDPVKDAQGHVRFAGQADMPTPQQRQKHYFEASRFAYLHHHLFDYNSQHLARQARGLTP